MLKIVLLVTALAPVSIMYGQTFKCVDFHVGKFVIHDEFGGETLIKRTKKFQIEYGVDEKTGKKFKSKDKVVWIDECTYQLHPVTVKHPSLDIGDEILTFKIIEMDKAYYVVQLRSSCTAAIYN